MATRPITSTAPGGKALDRRSPPLPFEHRPSLDGIRAVAALLVILFHAGMPSFGHGYTGVDVFFVLSGFLITSLLVRELLGTGRLRFVAFYARRVRRLLPAALVVLLVTAVAYELVASPVAVSENRGGFIASALYFANWFFLAQSQDYFAEEAHPSPVQHYWSLSVEEQFYLVWPALVLGLVLLARRYRLRLDVAAGGLALAGVIYAGVLAAGNPMASYFGTPARAYQLLLGAAVALLCLRWERPESARASRSTRPGGATLAAGGLVLILAAGSPLLGTSSAYWHGVAAAFGTALLILGLEMAPSSPAGRGLAWAPARYVGRWSYAAYLWHWPVIIVGDDAGVLPHAWLVRAPIVVAVTLALSSATFYLIEKPAGRVGLRTFPRQRLVAACGVVFAVVVALLFPAVLQVNARAEALLEKTNADPGKLVTVAAGGGHGRTVLLVGDSHARYLYPALADLADAQGWLLVPAIESGCPWPRVQATAGGGLLDCETIRHEALQVAARTHPDIVILVSRSIVRRPLRIGDDVVDPGGPGWLRSVTRGTGDFLADLRPLVGRVVIIEPLPETSKSMVECLATGSDPEACAAPAVNRPGTVALESFWRRLPDVASVSLDELICPDGICPAMVDGIPTHKDTNHITVAFSHRLAHPLDDYLRSQGIVLSRGEVRVRSSP
ncbi:MAG TPA: acyltransferase family protein [Gaiellaceae bacterium]